MTDITPLRVFAQGGGVQSTAALVLSAQGKIDFPVHLFSNVGDDSEHPDTLRYVREVSIPFAQAHGLAFHELRRPGLTLRQCAEEASGVGVYIPIRGSQTGKPYGRECTDKFKVRVLNQWIKERGATAENPAVMGLGISLDEIERASGRHGVSYRRVTYPLLDLGVRRVDCLKIVADAGLPEPPKSSCYFCPFHRPQVWAEMRRDRPDLFEMSAQLEDAINEHRSAAGKDPAYLTRFGRPLRDAVGTAQTDLFNQQGPETCDEGLCFV